MSVYSQQGVRKLVPPQARLQLLPFLQQMVGFTGLVLELTLFYCKICLTIFYILDALLGVSLMFVTLVPRAMLVVLQSRVFSLSYPVFRYSGRQYWCFPCCLPHLLPLHMSQYRSRSLHDLYYTFIVNHYVSTPVRELTRWPEGPWFSQPSEQWVVGHTDSIILCLLFTYYCIPLTGRFLGLYLTSPVLCPQQLYIEA